MKYITVYIKSVITSSLSTGAFLIFYVLINLSAHLRSLSVMNTALKHNNNFADHISIVTNNSMSPRRLVVSRHLTITTTYANKNCIRPTFFMQTRVWTLITHISRRFAIWIYFYCTSKHHMILSLTCLQVLQTV